MTDNNEPQWKTEPEWGRMSVEKDGLTVRWTYEKYGKLLPAPTLRVFLPHQCDEWDIVGDGWYDVSEPDTDELQELIDDLKWAQSVVQLGPPIYNPED